MGREIFDPLLGPSDGISNRLARFSHPRHPISRQIHRQYRNGAGWRPSRAVHRRSGQLQRMPFGGSAASHTGCPAGECSNATSYPTANPNACATVVVCRRCPRRADERADGAGVYRKGWRSSPKLRARRNPNRRKATTDKACQPTLVARFWALPRCNGHHTPIPGVSRSRMRPSRMG